MLFKARFLDGIAAGHVTLAFRRWRRPSVKPGGALQSPVGLLAIDKVEQIELAQIKMKEAARAGFASLAELRADLESQRDAPLYRIAFRLVGPDPRIELRGQAALTRAEREALQEKLDRLDRGAARPWTKQVLELIAAHPETSAAELARLSGHAKDWLKLNVRKLKNLGLTESLHPGYRLSPRGRAFLEHR